MVYGHDEEIPYPSFAQQIDYELELGFVVGGAGRNLDPEQAERLLFGLTIFNDFSARDIQAREMGLGMGPQKCKDFAYGIGPWITTIGDPALPPAGSAQRKRPRERRVLGDRRHRGNDLFAGGAHRIRVGRRRGATGRHHRLGHQFGNGSALELGRHLRPGDVVELEVEGVGVLRNRFSSEPEPYPWWPEPRPNPFEAEAAPT